MKEIERETTKRNSQKSRDEGRAATERTNARCLLIGVYAEVSPYSGVC